MELDCCLLVAALLSCLLGLDFCTVALHHYLLGCGCLSGAQCCSSLDEKVTLAGSLALSPLWASRPSFRELPWDVPAPAQSAYGSERAATTTMYRPKLIHRKAYAHLKTATTTLQSIIGKFVAFNGGGNAFKAVICATTRRALHGLTDDARTRCRWPPSSTTSIFNRGCFILHSDPDLLLSGDGTSSTEWDMRRGEMGFYGINVVRASLRPSRIVCSSRAVELLVKSITCVTKTHRFEEVSDIENLSKSLLELFRLDVPGMCVVTRRKLELQIDNIAVDASPGVAVETEVDDFIRLVVQIDRSFKDRDHDPEAEMIASGIAAYQELLDRVCESPPQELLLPGIVMRGTCPTFYLMRLSREMVECVKQGRRPGFSTRVDQYVLPGLVPPSSWDAIIVPEHRAHIAQCLESLKSFM
ncbi:hypothetical protein SELMODRAFT_444057 [Selaginella moellendorffii]|uniref:Uncharacterized protein n=1 Tax=Selaginella moellendorffii TaxID=88036 RepID=D8S6X6_SELML|nr:hypothetical protein SELMODRAFT_444057 [Selaginella moellendorffii]